MRDQLHPYFDFVKDQYGRKDPAHDFRHIERIVSRLPMLAEGLSPRWDILYFLACFHGLSTRIREEAAFQSSVRQFLRGLGWHDAEIGDLFTSLMRHLNAPETVEERVVHDANYLELLGAFGIAKAFTTGGARGQSYEETADIFEHCYLDRAAFTTPAGQRIAEEQRAYAKEFLRRLREEWQGPPSSVWKER